jgi:mRNA-decapping enzyme subunit 2
MKVFGAICVNSCGEVLLVRGRRSGKWSFPKGHCQGDENDLECALRELKEETGVDIKDIKYSSYHKLRGGGYFVFPLEGCPDTKIRDHWEVKEVKWWPVSSLPRLDSNVDVSIIRSLMKNSCHEQDDIVKFIDSPEARRKVSMIKNNIAPR